MAFRLPPTIDGRVHNEDAITVSREISPKNQQYLEQNNRQPVHAMDGDAGSSLDSSYHRTSTRSSDYRKPRAKAYSLCASSGRNIVFPDPVAFRYLEEDPEIHVVERKAVLAGYELYLVEQWACSRKSPTLVIVTYTGDEKHNIAVGVLNVPADKEQWSAKLRVYFKALEQNHARPKETPLGELMITNLSSFPSALTVIPVPNGDIRKHRQCFIVNENLKRLGCSGRAGLTLTEPSDATRAKFYQLYKVSDRVAFYDAVMELVKLCQVALLVFGKLEHEYIDGLLCDITEMAVNNWWAEIGSGCYNIEPTDGILGPTTVAALLGTLMGARNRLAWCSAAVSKDVFEIDATKRGIGAFQKSQKLERTRRLDRQTLLRLHIITAKAAAGETWGVQKAVKSTVAEIGGKRGELVIGLVGGRDKGGMSDVETLDIEKFVSLATGERAKWLWHGKPRRNGTIVDMQGRASSDRSDLIQKDNINLAKPTGKKASTLPVNEEGEARAKEQSPTLFSAHPSGSGSTTVLESSLSADRKRTVFKSVAGRMSDARSGLGRIKDAVEGGLRGHASRMSKDEPFSSVQPQQGIYALPESAMLSSGAVRAFTWKQKPEEYLAMMRKVDPESLSNSPSGQRKDYQGMPPPLGPASAAESSQKSLPLHGKAASSLSSGAEIRKDIVASPPSVVGSVTDERGLRNPIIDEEQGPNNAVASLYRRHSVSGAQIERIAVMNEARWPRRMSFSYAEEAVLSWEEMQDFLDFKNPDAAVENATARYLYSRILSMKEVEPWILSKIGIVEALDAAFGTNEAQLKALYYQLSEAYQRTKEESQEIVSEQRAQAADAIKNVEVVVARLEYEINSLASKVQEVEDGVEAFEREVEAVELRAEELKAHLEKESWLYWLIRNLTGIGTGPNITRLRT